MEEKIMPFSSVMLQNLVSTPEMRAVWTEERMLEKWMEFEKAITEAQAELGMIPEDAAEEILKKCSLEYLKPAHVREVQKTVGHLMVSFIKAFREVCGPAAEHFHLGPTTQDIIDTGLTLKLIRNIWKMLLSW